MTASPVPPDAAAFAPRDKRLTTILLVGRLSTGTRDDLCRVRNISPGGMRIETLAPIEIGQHIEVELKNGVTVHAEVVWVRHPDAGVKFDEPVDVEQVLAPAEPVKRRTGLRVIRSPRLSARCPVALRCDGRILAAVLTDISQGGAKLQWSGASRVGAQIVLFIPGLASRRATVRWVLEDAVGLFFAEKLAFADLAQWLASPDRFAPQATAQPGGALSQNR